MLNRVLSALAESFDRWFANTSGEVLTARHGDRAAYLRDVLTGSIEVESF